MRQQIHNLRLKKKRKQLRSGWTPAEAALQGASQIVEKKFRRSGLGRCRALHRKRPRVRLHPYRTPAQEGNLEFCTLRTDRSLTRWTCPARNRVEFNFLTSTTPADAGASAVPSSAEEGSWSPSIRAYLPKLRFGPTVIGQRVWVSFLHMRMKLKNQRKNHSLFRLSGPFWTAVPQLRRGISSHDISFIQSADRVDASSILMPLKRRGIKPSNNSFPPSLTARTTPSGEESVAPPICSKYSVILR